MMGERLAALRRAMAEQKLDALVVSQAENRRYLSGFTGSAGVLIVTGDAARLATDFRYYEQVRQQAPEWELVEVPEKLPPVLAEQLRSLDAHRVGFEKQALTVETWEEWREAAPDITWVGTAGLVEALRQVKDETELAAIVEAVRLTDEAMAHLYAWMRPGVTEREVAWELEVAMRTAGAEALAFAPIVASGPRGAMAHAVPTDKPIEVGEPVVIDMGCMVDGYRSDLTRSFCLGEADARYRSVWQVVLQAQEAAEQAMAAGMGGADVDRVARDIIYGAGYEGQFGHGLGHGVGLNIHEGPRAGMTSTDTLPEGAVMTVEPGIYIPGWGGVRLEDVVLVQDGGVRVLTQVAKLPVVGGR